MILLNTGIYKLHPMKASFYCQKVCGEVDFSIDEWNKAYKYCDDAGIEGIERDKILSPELFPCIRLHKSGRPAIHPCNLCFRS